MAKFTNTTMAPIHVGGVMIVPGQSADISRDEPMLKAAGFKALVKAGDLHEGDPTPEELADLDAQAKALAERMAAEGKNPDGTPMAKADTSKPAAKA